MKIMDKKEIEETKKFLWDIDDYYTEYSTDENGNVIDEEMNKKAEKINNANYYIMQLEQENKKLNKMIDEMLIFLSRQDLGYYSRKSFCKPYKPYNKEDWKQYFEKKVEEK